MGFIMALNIAIYGYDTDVGKIFIELLNNSNLSFDNVYPLSPLDGDFDAISIKNKNYLISSINDFDFDCVDVFFLMCTKDESIRLEHVLKTSNAIVVDCSNYFYKDEQSIVVNPRLTPYLVKQSIQDHKIISVANPTSTMLAQTLAPLHDEFGVARANITSLISVSELGLLGTEGLAYEAICLFNGQSSDNSPFETQMAFNLIPKVGDYENNLNTSFENNVIYEVNSMLDDFENRLSICCIYMPIFYGHCANVYVELEEDVDIDSVSSCLNQIPYIKLINDDIITPVTHLQEENDIVVTRLKMHDIDKRSLSFMVMIDNNRAGLALSCVEILNLINNHIN